MIGCLSSISSLATKNYVTTSSNSTNGTDNFLYSTIDASYSDVASRQFYNSAVRCYTNEGSSILVRLDNNNVNNGTSVVPTIDFSNNTISIDAFILIATGTVTNQCILGLGSNTTDNPHVNLCYDASENTIFFEYKTNLNNAVKILTGRVPLYPFSWSHISLTFNKNELYLHVNGIRDSVVSSVINASFNRITIAKEYRILPDQPVNSAQAIFRPFYGWIAGLRISKKIYYNRDDNNFLPSLNSYLTSVTNSSVTDWTLADSNDICAIIPNIKIYDNTKSSNIVALVTHQNTLNNNLIALTNGGNVIVGIGPTKMYGIIKNTLNYSISPGPDSSNYVTLPSDGTSFNNQTLNKFSLDLSNNPFTIEFYLALDEESTMTTSDSSFNCFGIIGAGCSFSNNHFSVLIRNKSNKVNTLCFFVKNGTSETMYECTTSMPLDPSPSVIDRTSRDRSKIFRHYAITKSNEDRKIRMFYNGNLVYTSTNEDTNTIRGEATVICRQYWDKPQIFTKYLYRSQPLPVHCGISKIRISTICRYKNNFHPRHIRYPYWITSNDLFVMDPLFYDYMSHNTITNLNKIGTVINTSLKFRKFAHWYSDRNSNEERVEWSEGFREFNS